ncbi:MAG: ATP-binding protein [Porticoccaceae bacterium]|nr:ATP-binding protein [Porticoccaceae bacterium]
MPAPKPNTSGLKNLPFQRAASSSWPLRSRAWAITAIYALIAILWIYFSDRTLVLLVDDPDTFSRWSTYKGAIFVAVTAVLLMILIWRAFHALEQAYDALREMNEGLELQVTLRTRELENALVRAEAADRLKSAFLATMSHELRTPLNSIIGFTGLLRQELPGPLNSEQEKQLGMVYSSAGLLLDLINDILDLSKIEAGQLPLKSEIFPVRNSLERVLASIAPQAASKGLVVINEISPALSTMYSDRRRVEQIALNLLNNAIKFTNRGSITLQATLVKDPVPSLQLVVRDTGIGIKAEDQALLFLPFSQVDSGLTRQHEGTGLGLAICRRLTELLGGSISVNSQWQQGSEFSVVLPLKLPPQPPSSLMLEMR